MLSKIKSNAIEYKIVIENMTYYVWIIFYPVIIPEWVLFSFHNISIRIITKIICRNSIQKHNFILKRKKQNLGRNLGFQNSFPAAGSFTTRVISIYHQRPLRPTILMNNPPDRHPPSSSFPYSTIFNNHQQRKI